MIKINKIEIIIVCVVVVIILASSSNVVGYQTVRSINQKKMNTKAIVNNIITVDDEPGDADFTSIKAAVNSSSPGYTIKVYSGIYREDGIKITKENVSLLGIDHELGEGDDEGKPFIKPDGTEGVIVVEASHVIISGFTIEKLSSSTCITLGAEQPSRNQNNNSISDCYMCNPHGSGIVFNGIGRDIYIINNTIYDCNPYGISADSLDFTIKDNTITSCTHVGIDIQLCHGKNISYNTIRFCGIGIRMYYGSNNIIYGNTIGSCNTGILNRLGSNNIISGNNIELCPFGFVNENGGRNRIIENNFKECWYFLPWFTVSFIDFFTKDKWMGNYWDTWNGVGPKRIFGIVVLGIPLPFSEYGIAIPIPRFLYDWQPAEVPYDIL